jgi:hypothetical protein
MTLDPRWPLIEPTIVGTERCPEGHRPNRCDEASRAARPPASAIAIACTDRPA